MRGPRGGYSAGVSYVRPMIMKNGRAFFHDPPSAAWRQSCDCTKRGGQASYDRMTLSQHHAFFHSMYQTNKEVLKTC